MPHADASTRGSARALGAAAAGILVAVALAFAPALDAGFVDWDDPDTIAENPMLRAGLREGLAVAWSEPRMGLYVPLTYTAWVLVAHAENALGFSQADGAPDPLGFHALNVTLHAIASVLVLALLAELLGGVAAPALGALLFAVHPVQTEAVAWASGGKDVLATALGAGALLVHARAARSPRRLRAELAATALYAAALLAKPSAVAVPFAVLAIDTLLLGRSLGASARVVVPWLALALPVFLATRDAQTAAAPRPEIALAWRPLHAADALAFYLAKIVWPLDLAPDYGATAERVRASGRLAWSWLAPVGVAGALALARQPLRARLAAAYALIVAALLPVIGLVPATFHAISLVADRYLHPALLGPALALAALAQRLSPRSVWVVALVLAAIAVPATRRQTMVWNDTETLFTHTLARNPRSASAEVALAKAAAARGDRASALDRYERALAAGPAPSLRVRIEGNLGLLLLGEGRRGEALPLLERAHAALPAERDLTLALGVALDAAGRPEQAAAVYERSLAAGGFDPDVANNLAWMLATAGDAAPEDATRAIGLAERAVAAAANAERLDTLAVARFAAGQVGAARATAAQAAAAARREGRTGFAAEIEARAARWEESPSAAP